MKGTYRFSLIAGIVLLGIIPSGRARAQEPDDETIGASAAGEMLLMQRFGEATPRNIPATSDFLTTELATENFDIAPLQAIPPPFGVDIQVNNSGLDTPENTTQSETTLAVFGDTLCAGYNDSGANGLSGLARSPDLGNTWNDLGGINQSGDPVIAVHEASGTFYYAELATLGGNTAIGVDVSTDDCVNFNGPVDAGPGASGLASTTLNDKPWIAVDNTGGANDGNIYVCWTRFFCTDGNQAANCSDNDDDDGDGMVDEGSSELRFSRSINGGTSYVNEQILQPGGTAPFGCSVDVGPNGEVHVAWADRSGPTAGDIQFRSSNDAGMNFTATNTISTGNRRPGIDNVVACGNTNRPTLNGNIRMLHQVWIAADATGGPFNGNIYAVWASDPMGATDNSDVFFSRSTDGGVMWSAPVQMGTGGGQTDQFEPFVEVAGAGAVSVAWYDRRNDSMNNFNIDVFKAFSDDGGASFVNPLVQVTDTNFPVPPLLPNFNPGIAQCYMGEYIAIAGDDRNFYYLWGDNRNTLITANFPAPGRADPDVFFEVEEAPVVNDADLSVMKTDTPDPVVAGESLTYDITARNDGPDIALDVVVTDTLPSEVVYVSDTGGCDTSMLPTLSCDIGTLAATTSAMFSVTVGVPPNLVFDGVTNIVNTVEVDGVANDPVPGNDVDSENTTVVAVTDVAIVPDSFVVLAPPDEVFVGEDVPVTLQKEITNLGPSGPVNTSVTVSATAPPDSSVTPAEAMSTELALGLLEVRTVEEDFTVNCGAASQHSFTFDNEIAPLGATDPVLGNNVASIQLDVECVVPVVINIKPGSDPNSVRPDKGTIAVAILSTSAGEGGTPLDFDATTVDPLSVRFGPREIVLDEAGGASERHGRGHVEDAFELDESTKDGDPDLVLHFKAAESGIEVDDTEACVKGTFTDTTGTHKFFGCDAIRIVPGAKM